MKKIKLTSTQVLQLVRGETISAIIGNYYFDKDAEEYLSTGSDEYINIEVEE